MYLYETHLHSTPPSKCGGAEATAYIAAAKACGYAGMIFTNHFFRGNSGIDRSLPWERFVDAYRKDYLAAVAEGEKQGITVLFGVEEAIGGGREALIFGLSPDDFAAEPLFPQFDVAATAAFVHRHGGLMVAAHPFRGHENGPDPRWYDGTEAFNAGNTEEQNRLGAAFARETGLLPFAGSDAHNAARFGIGGIVTDTPITDNAALVAALKARQYRLKCDDRILPLSAI